MADRGTSPVLDEAGFGETVFAQDPQLAAQGWQFRFVAAGPRVRESVALYRSLGYRVRLEPVYEGTASEECRDCRLVALLRFKAIYTRRE